MAKKTGVKTPTKAIRIVKVLNKRGLSEWTDPSQDNLKILRGIAMQCLSYQEIADCIGVTLQTLVNWRKKSPEFAEAIELGREEADAVILAVNFDSAVRGDSMSLDRWWRYRLAPKFEKEYKAETDKDSDDNVIGKLDEVLQSLSEKMSR